MQIVTATFVCRIIKDESNNHSEECCNNAKCISNVPLFRKLAVSCFNAEDENDDLAVRSVS